VLRAELKEKTMDGRRAVVFDRDGVINRLVTRPDGRHTSPWSVDEVVLTPNIREAVAKVKKVGFLALVASNQPGVTNGDHTLDDLNKINAFIQSEVGLDDVECALDKECGLYKPGNGMIENYIQKYNIDRNKSYMIGDRWKDVEAGYRSGLHTFFIGRDYTKPDNKIATPDFIVDDPLKACDIIVKIYQGLVN